VLITTIKSIEPMVGTKTQPIKSRKISTCYPYIICSNIDPKNALETLKYKTCLELNLLVLMP